MNEQQKSDFSTSTLCNHSLVHLYHLEVNRSGKNADINNFGVSKNKEQINKTRKINGNVVQLSEPKR